MSGSMRLTWTVQRRWPMKRLILIPLVLLAGLTAACGSAIDSFGYDWADPRPVTSAAGWTFGPCEGGGKAPLVCITVDGVWKGVIEHGSAPLDTFAEIPSGASGGEALDIVTAEYVESFRQDRSAGCADWEFVPANTESVTVAGSDGRVVGFALRRDGVVTEVSETRFAVIDDEIHWLTANALDPITACLVDPEVAAPTVAEWETLRPGFAALAAGSIF